MSLDEVEFEHTKYVLNEALRLGIHGDDMEKTPERWWKMMRGFTTPVPFEFTTFPTKHKTMIVVQNIDFVSLCAHHLIPFFGTADVAYIPHKKLAGLSKLPRTVEFFMKDATTQEDLTNAIADFLHEQLDPMGVAVVLKAQHLCMSLRGVTQRNAVTQTSALTGVFLDNKNNARQEFLSLIR